MRRDVQYQRLRIYHVDVTVRDVKMEKFVRQIASGATIVHIRIRSVGI